METKKAVTDKSEAVKKTVDHLMKLVKANPAFAGRSGTGGDNAVFGAITKGGTFSTHHWACHRQMGEITSPVVVFNQFRKRPKSDIDYTALRAFFDWITSDTGPWRAFEGRNISHVPEDWKGSVTDFIWDYGWVWSRIDTHPSNLQHNFLTVARMVAEWPKLINKWHEWVSKGCDPAMAFLFLDLFTPLESDNEWIDKTWGYTTGDTSDKLIWKINRKNRYDWPVDVCTSGEDYVLNFLNGRVEALNRPYEEDQSYKPVNRVFGKNELDCMNKKTYPSTLFQLYSSKFGPGAADCEAKMKTKSSLGLTTFEYERHWFVSEAEIIDIIKTESERLHGKDSNTTNKQAKPGPCSARGVSSGAGCGPTRDSKGRFVGFA